jgi:predicted NACHT family NTPase
MLDIVSNDWINGVLEKPLHGISFIELGIKDRTYERCLTGRKNSDIFYEIIPPQTLLILGEPGSGKTMLLLGLAREMINRAEQSLEHPIPVVFNLSSWSVKRPPLLSG